MSRSSVARSTRVADRAQDLRQSEGVERCEVAFAHVAAVLDEALHGAIDGGAREVEGAVVPEARPERRGALGLVESDAIGEAHAGRDRREGHRRATARVRRERVEERKHVRQRGPAESLQRARSLVLLVRVVGGQLRQRALGPRTNVSRVVVHEAR